MTVAYILEARVCRYGARTFPHPEHTFLPSMGFEEGLYRNLTKRRTFRRAYEAESGVVPKKRKRRKKRRERGHQCRADRLENTRD
jgi:hypothetical protein